MWCLNLSPKVEFVMFILGKNYIKLIDRTQHMEPKFIISEILNPKFIKNKCYLKEREIVKNTQNPFPSTPISHLYKCIAGGITVGDCEIRTKTAQQNFTQTY